MSECNTGGCICGSMRYKTTGDPSRVTVCHCTWCQRRTGTAFGVEVVFDDAQVEMIGDTLSQYKHISQDSGRWVVVDFCSNCGGNLGFTLEAVPGIRTIAAGTFDDPKWIDAEKYKFRHVYVRSARNWSDIPGDVEVFEEHFRT